MDALPPAMEPAPASPQRLRRRADFVATAKGKRVHLRNFSLQGRARPDAGGARFGFTVTKKIGGAVERNRIRRRLKEALRLMPDLAARANHDYVVVARSEALAAPFTQLQAELRRAVGNLHQTAKPAKPGPPQGAPGDTMTTKDRAPTQ